MTAASPSDPLGFDAYLDADLDRSGRSATGLELVQNMIPHRLMADSLPCIDAPGGEIPFGVDVRKWIGAATTDADLEAKGPLIDAALHLDPRVASVAVALSIAPAGTLGSDGGSEVSILIALSVVTITGQTIDRIVGVSAVSVGYLAG